MCIPAPIHSIFLGADCYISYASFYDSLLVLGTGQAGIGGGSSSVRKLIGEFSIELDQVAEIEAYDEKELNLRLFGSGGFLGYLGIFRNKSLGKYMAYVGDYSQAFWVKTKSGKCYMFSCENRDLLLSAIRKEMHHTRWRN